MFVLRFYGPVNPLGSCRARSVYLTSLFLGRLSPDLGKYRPYNFMYICMRDYIPIYSDSSMFMLIDFGKYRPYNCTYIYIRDYMPTASDISMIYVDRSWNVQIIQL